MTARVFIFGCALVFCVSLVSQPRQHLRAVHPDPLLYTMAPEYLPLGWLQGDDRFPRGATVFLRTSEGTHPLVPGFFATADANTSFDGTSVLFAGKHHASDSWQIWEITVPDGTARQVTYYEGDCVRPFYLPGERFVYARKLDGKYSLEIASLKNASEPPWQLTHAPGNFLPSDVLEDGRILFASGYPLENSKTSELYTVYTDGSAVESYRCDHGHSRYAGKQISGNVVFAQAGKLLRFASALDHEVPIATPEGIYAGDVAEMPGGAWVVSWHDGHGRYFELRAWTPRSTTLQPLISSVSANIVQPAVFAPRPIPNRHPSGLHEWSYANVLCLNAYTSREHIPDGSINSVRLYSRDAHGTTQLQGTAPVEKDGSFYLRVPGDRPLRIELLDSAGKTVKSEAGWFWLRSGEQRICVGCHAGPERAPENAVPQVLLRSTVAADLTTAPKTQAPAAGGH